MNRTIIACVITAAVVFLICAATAVWWLRQLFSGINI
jgi:hypothetical protein